jgi:hypothetical protein
MFSAIVTYFVVLLQFAKQPIIATDMTDAIVDVVAIHHKTFNFTSDMH